MRYTIVHGIDDSLRIDLGGDVSIICEVMDIGKAIDYLTFEAEMTGAELLAFMRKFHVKAELEEGIKAENRYTVTAYDW
ncbi:MAG: hypothetical protein IJX27_06510 [Clostridia bacterium]|nr:hypothetical protein [Clostridia bacterium]